MQVPPQLIQQVRQLVSTVGTAPATGRRCAGERTETVSRLRVNFDLDFLFTEASSHQAAPAPLTPASTFHAAGAKESYSERRGKRLQIGLGEPRAGLLGP